MDYQYEPLASPDSEIRVALLQPGAYDDEIYVSFQIITLEEDLPHYEALSYVWGSSEDPSCVRINDNGIHSISITRNLDIALRHFRYGDKPRLIWADALCVDQQSTSEKNGQVALMGDIYSMARSVMIWLGPEESGSNDALALLTSLSKEVETNWNTGELRPSSYCTSMVWADINIPLPFRDRELTPVLALFQRPYFRRAWIRQETVLAKEATMYCGSETMPWEDFRLAVACIHKNPVYHVAVEARQWFHFQDAKQIVYDLCRLRKSTFHFMELRYTQGTADCKDRRDRIYSILSLLNERDRRLKIKPNYGLSVEHVFTDIARRILVDQRSLAFLETCYPASNALEIPTWVPDWSLSSPVSDNILTVWSASGWISAQSCIKHNRLYVNGVAKARIETVVDLKVDGDRDEMEIAHGILRQLKPAQGVLDTTSPDWQDTLRKYCLAFSNYTLNDFYHPPRDSPTLEETRQALEYVWSCETDFDGIERTFGSLRISKFLYSCYLASIGRCFFSGDNGYLGLGPADTQEGDMICVFLGCRFPIIIRPVPVTGTGPLWRVVGPVIVPGLMHGEAIYRHKLPNHYKPVEDSALCTVQDFTDGYPFVLHDTENMVFIADPASVLEEVDIKVEHYQREPHELEVLPETLRAAGVELEEFVLV